MSESSAQLDQRLDTLLRSCIECGLCLPYCATHLASGDETLSPRGRLLLLRHARQAPLAPDVREAFDSCLGCLACVTVCPSGIQADLLHHLKDIAAGDPGWAGPVPVSALDRPAVLHTVHALVRATRRVLRGCFGASWRRRLDRGPGPVRRLGRLLGTLPTVPDDIVARLDVLLAGRPVAAPVEPAQEVASSPPLTLAWFAGCASGTLMSATSSRLRELLQAAGCHLVDVAGQDCCGALAAHSGRPGRAAALRTRNVKAFGPHLDRCDHVVVEAAGCGFALSDYPEEFASKVCDAVVLLNRLALPPLGSVPLRVALHHPCHARHAQHIMDEPARVLTRIPGLIVLEPAEVEVCCGSAGSYAVQRPELSAAMGRRKAEVLAATGCDVVVTSNPGCLGQIADGLALVAPHVPIIPLSDLVWYAWRRGHV